MMICERIILYIYHVVYDFISMLFAFNLCKSLFLTFVFYFLFFYLKNITDYFFKKINIPIPFIKSKKLSCYGILSSLYLLGAIFCFKLVSKCLLYRYPLLIIFIYKIYISVCMLFFLKFVISIVNMIIKIYDQINNHRSIAIISFFQLFKIFAIAFCILFIISFTYDIKLTTLLSSLGTLTAVLVLIFRDTILGFVSGFQIAAGKIVKKGDWISLPKHSIEGKLSEINLFSSKIENFDRSVSNVPTSYIISSVLVNFEFMTRKNIRRIKYPILFDITKFKFYKDIEIDNILNNFFFTEKIITSLRDRKNNMYKINNTDSCTNVTNIMLFKYYIISYLKRHPNIAKEDVILVHDLPMTTAGLPVEIYCFINTKNWINHSILQSDIFDHIITMSKEFDLLIIQKR